VLLVKRLVRVLEEAAAEFKDHSLRAYLRVLFSMLLKADLPSPRKRERTSVKGIEQQGISTAFSDLL
jgi:hypothetical protein